jgi:hypothetical protein
MQGANMKIISDLFEQKIEDKIRGSFMASPPSNANIYCINCHNPFLQNMERIVCTAERRVTEVVVSQWCCGEGEGHAPSEPEGNILKPSMEASVADSSVSNVFEIYHYFDRCM